MISGRGEMSDMTIILEIIAGILILTVFSMIAPALIGIGIGIFLIKDGSIIGGLLSIILGVGTNILMYIGGSAGGYSGSDDCPYCGSGDTDGNHCYSCDEEF